MSSGILFLTTEDFTMSKTNNGFMLNNFINGFSLILFYSPQCPHCKNLLPVFKKLPSIVGGCQFGILNVSANKSIIELSKKTVSPITYVPYIILYINGKPFMLYEGPPNEEEIKRFIVEVSKKIQSKQKFSESEVKTNENSIPAYCLGNPLYGDDNKTYLVMDEAYKK